ncbi:MAG: MBL fold metallo-hydrolase [Thermoguttaceae bacterium]|jgi:L-ascorbate metabolism protein UlaG (beta-lactamase superfamily)|nr:MBL fold metallo-hydrolase [Thermoguttaceae bacterium]
MKHTLKKLTWLGHNCFLFEYGKTKFITDPFLTPDSSPISAENIEANYILVSHGHDDHCADALVIAKNNKSPIIAIPEVAGYFAQKGAATEPVNIGGAVYVPLFNDINLPKAQVLAVQAPHSSTLSNGAPGGNSLGFVLSFSQNEVCLSPNDGTIKPMRQTLEDASAFSIYFACDTGYFSEMSWIGRLGIDLAVLPIGDRYTMGPSTSLDAIEAIQPRYVVPSHYNTWPPISQNVEKWRDSVRKYTKSEPILPIIGSSIEEQEDGSWR